MAAITPAQSTAKVPADGLRLVRGLSLLDATMIVIGSMIGSGIFIVSAKSMTLVGSPGWMLAAWAIAGVITITGALCCAELAAMMPHAGGQYVFLREAYGPAQPDFCSAGPCSSSCKPERLRPSQSRSPSSWAS